jgi:heme exporter protein D
MTLMRAAVLLLLGFVLIWLGLGTRRLNLRLYDTFEKLSPVDSNYSHGPLEYLCWGLCMAGGAILLVACVCLSMRLIREVRHRLRRSAKVRLSREQRARSDFRRRGVVPIV